MTMRRFNRLSINVAVYVALAGAAAYAQQAPPGAVKAAPTMARINGESIEVPADYVIGAQDVISIVFWRDKDMSADVTVRPDGKISLPLIHDLQAAGYTPEQLRQNIQQAASKFVEDPNASVVVKEIH